LLWIEDMLLLGASMVPGCGAGSEGEIVRDFFRLWWRGVFAGVFVKCGCKTWCFCGEFVVDAWCTSGKSVMFFDDEKRDTFFDFILGRGATSAIRRRTDVYRVAAIQR